jgi:hypothetical protein
MSDSLFSALLTEQQDTLTARYLAMLRRYDALAVRNKWRLMALWGTSMGLTWVPLLLAIAALSGWLPSWLDHLLLSVVLPTAGFLNAAVTVAQLILLFRGRWLRYRAATERLGENGMRFRVRLSPFARADAEAEFGKALGELEAQLNAPWTARLWDLIPWRYLVGLWPLPEKLRGDLGHAPDEALYPRCDGDADAALILVRRLRNQWRWHLVKAGLYSRRYLAIQAGIVLLGLASAAYGFLVGRAFGPLALSSTFTLFLVAYREQLGYAPLCLRYTRICDTLNEIESEYLKLKDSSPPPTPEQRLAGLKLAAARVEKALASEFQYWYFGRENFGATSS